jgi:hypothetical protein
LFKTGQEIETKKGVTSTSLMSVILVGKLASVMTTGSGKPGPYPTPFLVDVKIIFILRDKSN